jgi:Tol biopolymer transport system component
MLVQPTEGAANADAKPISDGRSLEIVPTYTADGSRVLFSSNRAGRKLSIWSMPVADGPAVPEQLTLGVDGSDLWPSIDSNPRPRMYYESLIDTRPESRLYAKAVDGNRRDLTVVPAGVKQPRVSPTADAIVFCVPDEKTGNRDIYRMNDAGGEVVNLTKTPNVDEFDPTWSTDGLRIAYASNQGQGPETPDNHDVWVIGAAGGEPPVRVTSNPGWDDAPAWDPLGNAVYFRSNRGGAWNVWRAEIPPPPAPATKASDAR